MQIFLFTFHNGNVYKFGHKHVALANGKQFLSFRTCI